MIRNVVVSFIEQVKTPKTLAVLSHSFVTTHYYYAPICPAPSSLITNTVNSSPKSTSLSTISKAETSKEPWGFHMSVDAISCEASSIRCKEHIAKFTDDLVNKINMKAYGEAQIVMFGEGNKKGYTLVQLIETSNICAHFCEESNDMYFDLFSCKTFCREQVKSLIQSYFRPETMKTFERRR